MADPLEELRGLQMPPMDLGAVVAETCAALAIGLLAAWMIAGLLKLATARRIPAETRALAKLDAITDTPPDAALAARAAILQDYAAGIEGEGDWLSKLDEKLGGVFSNGAGKGLRQALYQPDVSFDVAGFDTDIRTALKQVTR